MVPATKISRIRAGMGKAGRQGTEQGFSDMGGGVPDAHTVPCVAHGLREARPT